MMNEKTIHTLEFDKIREMLSGCCITLAGRNKADALMPSILLSEIETLLQETEEASAMIVRKGSLPLGGFQDVASFLSRVERGGVLSAGELLSVASNVYATGKVKKYAHWENKPEVFDILDELFSALQPLPELEREINRCIVSENEIADDASPSLRSVRREMKVASDRVKDALQHVIHSQAYKNMLQDTVITMRSGRYCVPVKQEYKGEFPGMVHDQSQSGATLFMEPMSVVQLNNRIKELEGKEKAEIDKILSELSQRVYEHCDALKINTEIIGKLDFIFAKGSLAFQYKGSKPVFNTKGQIQIKKGRHPLLDPDKVVPIDIELGERFQTLLITGPNTGGKTVALKTLGLFTLMGQAGLMIPAFDNSKLAVFESVYADIGDEQSIEQSLSTFSSHMKNIVSILDHITPNALVLLDELGAGTDPTEGAALAISILNDLFEKGVRTAVTTHYSELKVYALSTEGVENASCEFDVETLRPTYRLLIGVPGKSNAFAISRRLGLSEGIIQQAKEFLSQENIRFEDVITDLEISKKAVVHEKERAESYRREAEQLKRDVESQRSKIQEQKDKILLRAQEEARQVLLAAKEEADAIIREMNKAARESKNQNEMNELRKKIKDSIPDVNLAPVIEQTGEVPENVQEGDTVFVTTLNRKGTVISANAAGDVMVQAGNMKIKVKRTDLRTVQAVKEKNRTMQKTGGHGKPQKALHISGELDVRGQTSDEALENVDKYLDDAFLSHMSGVMIIHGKGTGVLRQSIHQHLRRHPHVKSYRLGTFGEGEAGVTVVELK